MKVKRMIGLSPSLFDRLERVCNKYNLYRSSLINAMLEEDLKRIQSVKVSKARIRTKVKKVNFQINVNEDNYNAIPSPKIQRIEAVLDEVLRDYENGKERY